MKITFKKDYQMMGFTITEGTILTFVENIEPSGKKFKDQHGNQFNFDNSELLFSPDIVDVEVEK